MNILLINGSPKGDKSNTLRLANAFLEGICDTENHKVERLDISHLNIEACQGCFSCWKTTPGKCCIHDDMQTVLEKMLCSDLTIWSFPLYYFSLPGKLKTLMDRQLPLSLPFMQSDIEGGGHPARYDMSKKKTVLISTCGFYTSKSNYDSVTAQFDRIYGKGSYSSIFCGQGELFSIKELSKRTDEYLSLVREAGKEYAAGGIKAGTNARLEQLLFPRPVFERMADESWGITKAGAKEDSSLTFTRQMASLYNPSSYSGKDIVFDMDYTDIGKRYRIILGETESRVLEEFNEEPQTVIHTPFSLWQSIARGEIEGSDALMKHLYSVEGDFGLMLKWDDYFGQRDREKKDENGKTDMRCLLTPWIVFWIAANISAFWASILSILVCSSLPLLFYRKRKTMYDVISCALVSVFSLLLITKAPAIAVMPLSYLAFGIMWSISACRRIPLTAEYSMNDYGGKEAFRNPMFIRTNRILTATWGILYLITPIWTYPVMLTGAGNYVGLINSILPLGMGIFTLWFQKWYPERIARGRKTKVTH